MLRKRISVFLASIAVIAGGLVLTAPSANATNAAPTAATYGATAAVDVLRSPGYPACSGSTYNQWSVTSTGNPISQTAYNDTGSTVQARVDLSAVTYKNGGATVTAPMVLKVVRLAASTTPQGFALKMFLASDGLTEIFWDSVRDEWSATGVTLTDSFSSAGNAYAVYSGGFLHEGSPTTGRFGIGTFMMINDTLPTGTQLVYTPSPGADNACISSRTYATAAGMDSTNLGGSGTKITPSLDGPPPTLSLEIDPNGGVCRISEITGQQGTWTTAPDSGTCSKSGSLFRGFATSPSGTGTFISPGGPIFFLTSNRIYAIYETPRTSVAPTEIVATAGVNEVKISWKAPVDLGASSISNYLVRANPSGRVCVTSTVRDQNPLTCTMSLAATNTKYTFDVQALNAAGWGEKSAASNAVSPYNVVMGEVSRSQDRILFVKTGSTLSVKGRAPGVLEGTVVTPQIKIGSGQWVTETRDLPRVGRDQSISWSKKLKKSLNNQPVQVRLTVLGATAEANPVKIGARAGVATAPRNVKVTFTEARIPSQRKVQVSWGASANDGGSPITLYEVSLRVREDSLPATCRVPANKQLTCTLNTGVLERKKKYTVNVTAINASGQSKPAKVEFQRP